MHILNSRLEQLLCSAIPHSAALGSGDRSDALETASTATPDTLGANDDLEAVSLDQSLDTVDAQTMVGSLPATGSLEQYAILFISVRVNHRHHLRVSVLNYAVYVIDGVHVAQLPGLADGRVSSLLVNGIIHLWVSLYDIVGLFNAVFAAVYSFK